MDCKVNDGEKFDFLPVLDEEEERYEDHQEPIVTPPYTSMSSISLSFCSSFSSSENLSNGTPLSPPRKMRSLDDLYKVTNSIDEVTLYYHLVVSYGVWRSNKR